ncbi:MAG: glycosyltransferase family 2 protein [Spirochaetes bacterium]|nr:glycosyltransferase family 2 protein [Spirochaetota bacterium]HQG43340.1 glycosyltransferase family 2 protein [Spirochaetota bacterium]
MQHINASIVLYNSPRDYLKKSIHSLLNTDLKVKLYLIDNSINSNLDDIVHIDDNRIEYIFNDANLGYGKAHNIALQKSIEDGIPYHVVLNPDVYFKNGVLEELYTFMDKNKDVGLVMPRVVYPDGSLQYLCKLLPTPMDLILRRFIPFKRWVEKRNEIYELRFTGYNTIMDVPCLSGCFMFLRTDVLKKTGLFDERFFMYLEDTDLCRRINNVYKTVFYPYVSIYHNYDKGSYSNKELLSYHIKSAVQYFNKWGWFFDKYRSEKNSITIEHIKMMP